MHINNWPMYSKKILLLVVMSSYYILTTAAQVASPAFKDCLLYGEKRPGSHKLCTRGSRVVSNNGREV